MTLRSWKELKGRTLAQIGQGSGVPSSTLSRFLTGRNPLSAKNAELIVRYTEGEVTFADLMKEGRRLTKKRRGGDDEENTPPPPVEAAP